MKCQTYLLKKKKVKTMNSKMAKHTYLSTIESKKQTKQTEEQRQNHGDGERFDGCQMGGGCGEWVKR